MNPNDLSFQAIHDRFPRGIKVRAISDSDSKGTVNLVTRCDVTGAPRLIVKWDSTKIACQVHPTQVVAIDSE